MKLKVQPVYETSLTMDSPWRFRAIRACRQCERVQQPKVGPSKADEDLATPTTSSVDFAFLVAQTFGDAALESDLLGLFVAQARRILAQLPSQTARAQADAAHLLKGSARGIGAWSVADAAESYEAATATTRADHLPRLVAAVAEAETAIAARLAEAGRRTPESEPRLPLSTAATLL